MNYKGLSRSEWEKVQEKAYEGFLEKFRDRPTFDSVKNQIKENFELHWLQILMLAILGILALMTGIKAFTVAQPYGLSLMNSLAQSTRVDPLAAQFFAIVAGTFFALMSTPGVIYFTLMDLSAGVKAKKRQTEFRVEPVLNSTKLGWLFTFIWRGYFFDLEWWTPRLFQFLVYISLFFIALISWVNASWLMLSMWVLVTVTEVALAHFVAKVIQDWQDFRQAVNARLEPMLAAWEEEVSKYEEHPLYIRELRLELYTALKHKDISEGWFSKAKKPNYEIMDDTANTQQAQEIVLREMRRWMQASQEFASEYEKIFSDSVETVETNPVDDNLLPVNDEGQFIPPYNEDRWTPDAMKKHMLRRGLSPNERYSEGKPGMEGTHNNDYASGHGARSAFRELKNRGEWKS